MENYIFTRTFKIQKKNQNTNIKKKKEKELTIPWFVNKFSYE